jgi:hypothetical protein
VLQALFSRVGHWLVLMLVMDSECAPIHLGLARLLASNWAPGIGP